MSEQSSVQAPDGASEVDQTPAPAEGQPVVAQSSTVDIPPVDDSGEPESRVEPQDERHESGEQDEQGESVEQGERPARKPLAARVEDAGDVAADYLEELLDIADLDGDIDIDEENGRASVAIIADPVSTRALRRLVGADGEVLEALQELTRLAVQARTGERSRLMLDIAGHRAGRRTELEGVAARAVQECEQTGEPVRLDAMSPFERKVVHDAVAAAGLRSESEGEEPERRVVVLPATAP